MPQFKWIVFISVALCIFAAGCVTDSDFAPPFDSISEMQKAEARAVTVTPKLGDSAGKGGESYVDQYDDYCPDYANAQGYEDIVVAYDDYDGVNTITNKIFQPGGIEAVHIKTDHPFHLRKVRMYFEGPGGPVMIRIHPDRCNSWPEIEQDLIDPIYMVLPADAGWVTIDLPEPGIFRMPSEHFWIAYWHYHRSPYLGTSIGSSNYLYRNRFYDLEWAQNQYPFVWGGPQYNYMVEAEGSHFCERESTYFTDVSLDAGFTEENDHYMRVGWGDFNNDGYDDVLLTLGAQYTPPVPDDDDDDSTDDDDTTDDDDDTTETPSYLNRFGLFKNNGDGTFTEVTEEAGLNVDTDGDIAVWGDLNNDGYLDLVVGVNVPWYEDETEGYIPFPGAVERSTVLMNNGDETFTEIDECGLEVDDGTIAAAALADYNADGNLDVFIGAWLKLYPNPPSTPDYLFMGNGDGTFTDVSSEAGIWALSDTPAYGVMWADYDNDGDQDVYVSNYGRVRNRLWQNQGDGTFIDTAADVHLNTPRNAPGNTFGADFGDIDNDGDLDAFLAEISHPRYQPASEWSSLNINQGAPDYDYTNVFEEVGLTCDEGEIDPSFIDFDNDGRLDIFLSDLYSDHYCRLFHQNEDGTFTDMTYLAGINIHDCTNNAWADYDRDGDLDLMSTKRSPSHTLLYRNDIGQDNSWVTIKLEGTTTNRSAIGARVTVTAGDLTQIREVQGGKGHASSQASLAVEFGLADKTAIDEVKVLWPGGSEQTWEDVTIDSFVYLIEDDDTIYYE